MERSEATALFLQDALCAAGRWGQKTQAGYYDYDEHRKPTPSPVTSAIVAKFRDRAGIIPRHVTDSEIMVATMYTMVNEAAKILEEGIALRASDIDRAAVLGYNWPVYRGGPLFWADQIGLDRIVTRMRDLEASHGDSFRPAPLLVSLADEGRRFGDQS